MSVHCYGRSLQYSQTLNMEIKRHFLNESPSLRFVDVWRMNVHVLTSVPHSNGNEWRRPGSISWSLLVFQHAKQAKSCLFSTRTQEPLISSRCIWTGHLCLTVGRRLRLRLNSQKQKLWFVHWRFPTVNKQTSWFATHLNPVKHVKLMMTEYIYTTTHSNT